MEMASASVVFHLGTTVRYTDNTSPRNNGQMLVRGLCVLDENMNYMVRG